MALRVSKAVTKTRPAVQPLNNFFSSERRLPSTGPALVTASIRISQLRFASWRTTSGILAVASSWMPRSENRASLNGFGCSCVACA